MSEPSTPSPSDKPEKPESPAAPGAEAAKGGPSSDPHIETTQSEEPVVSSDAQATSEQPVVPSDAAATSGAVSDPALPVEPEPSEPKRAAAAPPGPPPPQQRKAGAMAGTTIEAAFVQANLPARQWPPKVVADVMTRQIIALGENEPLGDLESGMKQFRFRHLPVVGAGNKLVGIITRSDLLHAALGTHPDGTRLEVRVGPTTRAGEIMRRQVLTARVDSPLASAGRVMTREKIGCLPVILEDQTLVGIVTDTDYMLVALELLERAAK